MSELDTARVSVLGRLLAPVEPDEFFTRFFEQAPLHVARRNGAYFADLCSVADIEAALQVGAATPGYFRMTKDGNPVNAADLLVERTSPRARLVGRSAANVLDPRAVAARLALGHTLLVNDLGLFSPRVAALCNSIQHETLIFVQVNAYLTPPNERGFSLHHDTHDTLVLQIEGEKRWEVHAPLIELPIESQPVAIGAPDRAPRTFDLQAGDTLYLPRGYRHACTAGESRSLHLTLALLPVRAIELAEAALRVAAVDDVELRRALALGWQDAEDLPESFSAFITERLRAALGPACIRAARDLVTSELFAATRTVAEGTISAAAQLAALEPSTRIALRGDGPFVLRDWGANVQLVAAGKTTTLPAGCTEVLRALAAGPLTLAAIDALIPGRGAELVRLLVLDGLASVLA